MSVRFAVESVNPAAIRAFDATVGGNRQKYARMAVPGFVRGAAAMQWQVGGGDDDGGLGLVGHDVSLSGGCGLDCGAALPCCFTKNGQAGQ